LYDKKASDDKISWERKRIVLNDWPTKSEPATPKNQETAPKKEQNLKEDYE
jgi:hypothetical protein